MNAGTKTRHIARNGHSFHVNPKDYEKFWTKFESGDWEKRTIEVFDRYIDGTTTYLDIGAWIGPTLLYAANLAGKCAAVEADPIAFERLNENLSLNRDESWHKNVALIHKAISDKPGPINFGSLDTGGDSMSSILWGDSETSWQVDTVKPDELIEMIQATSNKYFIKIDIEGSEFTMLESLKQIFGFENAVIYLSLHNKYLRQSVKSKYKGMNYLKRTITVRSEIFALYRKLYATFPANKRCSVNGRIVRPSVLTDIHIWLFCKPPRERKTRDVLMVPDGFSTA